MSDKRLSSLLISAEHSSPFVGEGRKGGTAPAPDTAHPVDPLGPVPSLLEPNLSGSLQDGRHILPIRVYYEDTDFSGVVYHASYLRFMERGRTDFLRLGGIDQSALHRAGEGLVFAVRRMTIDFVRPARMDDVLMVETCTREVRGASLVLAQRVLRDGEILVTAEVRVAALAGGRPTRIPDPLRAVLDPARAAGK